MNLPNNVQMFVDELKANAKKRWNEEEYEHFLRHLIHISKEEDGSIIVSDGYERLFSEMYIFKGEDVYIGNLYSDEPPRLYSFELAMCDASIMFTG